MIVFCVYLYIYNEEMFFFFFLFVNHVKTTEPINMGLRPHNAKSFEDGHRLLFCIPYTLPHFILD